MKVVNFYNQVGNYYKDSMAGVVNGSASSRMKECKFKKGFPGFVCV